MYIKVKENINLVSLVSLVNVFLITERILLHVMQYFSSDS